MWPHIGIHQALLEQHSQRTGEIIPEKQTCWREVGQHSLSRKMYICMWFHTAYRKIEDFSLKSRKTKVIP